MCQISTTGGYLLMVDGFDGVLVHVFCGFGAAGTDQFAPQACFAPDSRHVLCGSPDGAVCVWKVPESSGDASDDDGAGAKDPAAAAAAAAPEFRGSLPILKLPDTHPGPATIVACSPTLETMASACSAVALWTNPAPRN